MAGAHPRRCPQCGRGWKRSLAANARYWKLLTVISQGVKLPNEDGSEQFSTETWHEYFKRTFLGFEDVRLPSGEVITRTRSTADPDLEHDAFCNYMQEVEVWAAECGVYLPDREGA